MIYKCFASIKYNAGRRKRGEGRGPVFYFYLGAC